MNKRKELLKILTNQIYMIKETIDRIEYDKEMKIFMKHINIAKKNFEKLKIFKIHNIYR